MNGRRALRKLGAVVLGLWCLLGCGIEAAFAYSRAYVPLNVAIATADAIAVVRTVRTPEATRMYNEADAEVVVLRVLKGTLPLEKSVVQLNPYHAMALGPLQNDKEYIIFLKPAGTNKTTEKSTPVETAPARFEVMIDGTQLHDQAKEKAVASAIKLMPAWSEPQRGLSTVLVPSKFHIKANEHLDVSVGYKNVTDKDITLKYRNWPLQTHTYWKLHIESPADEVIAPLAHPHLTPAQIADYFSRNPNPYDFVVKPGQAIFMPLQRINTAQPGWGYKERLDFKYYPMTRPGRYRIAASGYNFHGDTVTTAKGLQVWVEE